jgi:1A family penicillin-binding protein
MLATIFEFLGRVSEPFANAARAHHRAFVATVVTLGVLVCTAVGLAVWLLVAVVSGLPDDDAIRGVGSMSRSTTVFDAYDAPAFTIFKEQRIEAPLSRVSPHVIAAILAVEDQRFFHHGGVDVIRVAGAAWNNLLDGWGSQGGSTITQQLARQSFLTREKTVRRKLTEILVAIRLEKAFSKKQILELYLNKVYFGDGLYGVEAASLGYFGKHAADLDLAEAALLAGLVKAPSTNSPSSSPTRARARRNAALEVMRAAGAIDARAFQAAVSSDVRLKDTLRGHDGFGQYFQEEVRKQLVQQFGWERVYQGGLKVYTTIDLDVQKAAEAEVMRAVSEIEQRQAQRRKQPAPANDPPLQAALVALDPHTGEVRAMVGGRSFDHSRFNRATQARRQAGSAFKPFVYAAALERGYTPASMISTLATPVMTLQGAWVPDDHSTGSEMTMRAALKTSSNRAAVRMLQDIGIPAALRASERLGLGAVPGVPSLALGSGEVTLLSMTAAYATFANGGMRPEPILIRRVETTEGEVLFTAMPHAERAVGEATAFLITTMLADVVNGGTGWQARNVGFKLPAAGKTGTTNDYRDAWFVGYTPHLAAGVWVGYDQPRTIIGQGYAGTLAVPLWGRFMTLATRNDKPDVFKAPRTVSSATICRLSGKLAAGGCSDVATVDRNGYPTRESMAYTEYFVRGTEPVEYCPLHTHAPFPGALVAVSAPAQQQPDRPAVAANSLPVPVATTGIFPAVSAAAASAQAAPVPLRAQDAPASPTRGFWGRFFRRGANESATNPASAPSEAAQAPAR